MFRHRGKLLQAAIALALLALSSALWPSLSASATHASLATYALASPTAVCPTPGNNACITNTPAASLTLNGTNQTATYQLVFTLNSAAQGSWHVTVTSTQFTSGGHTLPVNASVVTAVATAAACSGSSCPSNMITPPVSVPVLPTPPSIFYDNSPGGSAHGQGTFTIKATINVSVPANTYAGTYTCTVTIAFISGSP